MLTVDFKLLAEPELVCAPSSVKAPELPSVSLSTRPSLSDATEFKPSIINSVDAVPV